MAMLLGSFAYQLVKRNVFKKLKKKHFLRVFEEMIFFGFIFTYEILMSTRHFLHRLTDKMRLGRWNYTSMEKEFLMREGAGSGLWLTCLLPLSVAFGAWRFSNSTSFMYSTTGVVAAGLLGTTILYLIWSPTHMSSPISKLLFVVPPIGTLLGLLYIHNEHISSFGRLSTWPKSSCALSREAELFTGFLASLLGGVASSWPLLTGVPALFSMAPRCFSFGEALVIIQAVSLFVYSAVVNITRLAFSRLNLADDFTNEVLTASAILQVGLLGIFVMVVLLVLAPPLRQCALFYVLLASTASAILIILYFLLGEFPLLWIFKLILNDNTTILLVAYWVVCSMAAVSAVWLQLNDGRHATTAVRKVYHILAVAVYLPGVWFAPTLLFLASGIVLAIFILLEVIRIINIPPFGPVLGDAFATYADEKDVLIALTPIYLLCGCSFPLWLFPGPLTSQSLILLSGLLSVGLGDTAASIVGSKFGRLHWSGSPKTVEGTAACFVSQMVAVYLLAQAGYIVHSGPYILQATLTIAFVSMVETFTDQVDNLVMPLCTYLMFL